MRWFVVLSSATSTRPRKRGRADAAIGAAAAWRAAVRSAAIGAGAGAGRASIRSGRLNQNVEPSPTRLVTPICPPINSTRRLQIARPRPVPPKRRVVDASACTKRSNKRSIASGEMPTPVSSIAKRSMASG
jgi:hypothetical protein